ncbi:MAG TPA: DUF4129 domain-containing protein [Thermomicrobiaceae bacterium]|nr:DUF4129 domain-containing protein [Thermomicrobiaceae bacterium]
MDEQPDREPVAQPPPAPPLQPQPLHESLRHDSGVRLELNLGLAGEFGPLSIAADLLERLDWREELLSLALIAAESAIGYLVLGFIFPARNTHLTPFPGWLFFFLLAFAYFLLHILNELRVWSPEFELLVAAGLVLSLLVTLKIACFPADPWFAIAWLRGSVNGLILVGSKATRNPWEVVAVLVYAWWRGRARAEPMMETAYQMLRWGTLALTIALLLILTASPPQAGIRHGIGAAVIVFFTTSLAAVGIARFRLEGLRSGSPLGPNWLVTFAVPIGAIVLIAILAASFFSPGVVESVLTLLAPVFWVIGLIVRALVLLVALLAFVIVSPLLWLLERGGLPAVRLPAGTRIGGNPLAAFGGFAGNSLHIAHPLRYLIAGVVLTFFGSVLVRYLYRRRRRWRETAHERRESVLVWDDALGRLPERLRHLIGRDMPRTDSLATLRGDPRWIHTVAIRETYLKLLQLGRRAGVEREPDTTPAEYERQIAGPFPASGAEIGTITDGYDAARYGRSPATERQADEVQAAWSALASRERRWRR